MKVRKFIENMEEIDFLNVKNRCTERLALTNIKSDKEFITDVTKFCFVFYLFYELNLFYFLANAFPSSIS